MKFTSIKSLFMPSLAIYSALTLMTPGLAEAFDLGQLLVPPKYQRASLGLTGLYYTTADLDSEQTNTHSSFTAFNLSIPFLKTEDEVWTASATGSRFTLDMPQSPYPDLYDFKFGLSYAKSLEGDRQWSVLLNYGSASDKPFHDQTVSTLGVTALYSKPQSEVSKWLFLVNYSNNRPFLNNIPLPGVAWIHNPSKEFRAVLGLPFAYLDWQFAGNLGLNAMTLLPWTYRANLYYKFNPVMQAYTGFDFSQIVHYEQGRETRKERIFFDEKKLYVGFKSPLNKSTFADLEVGHAFDRRYFKSEDFKITPNNATELGNAAYLKLSLKFFL